MPIDIPTTITALLFTSISFSLGLATHPRSLSYPSADIAPVNAKITQNPFELTEMTDARQQSFEYILKGIEAEEADRKEAAREYYTAAIEADEENGWGWLLLGRLLRQPRLIEHSYDLFSQQNDSQGKAIAIEVMEAIQASY
jgi:tetratricopeptide (TPR) repeat protein